MAIGQSIDRKLIERAMQVGGEPSAAVVMTKALQEYIARHEQKRLLTLLGTLEWDDGNDYKAERER